MPISYQRIWWPARSVSAIYAAVTRSTISTLKKNLLIIFAGFAHPTVTAKERALPLERTVAYDVAEQRWLGACCVTRPRTVGFDEQVSIKL